MGRRRARHHDERIYEATPMYAESPERTLQEPDPERSRGFDEYDTLTDAMELIVQSTSRLESLLSEIASRFRRVVEFERCALALPDDDRRVYRVLTLFDARRVLIRAGERTVALDKGVAGRIFRAGKRDPIVETGGLPDPM